MNFFLLLFCALISVYTVGCADKNEITEQKLINAPIESYQNELLGIAFESVSAMPVEPHIKSRSSAQELVVKTCLELDQPKRALGYIKQIDNWRRQLCYADLALYCAHYGFEKADVQYFLNLAAQVPNNTEDWRKEQVDIKIDQTNAYLGQTKLISGSFEREMQDYEKLVSTGDFDAIENVLNEYSRLYKQYYNDVGRRTLIEEKIKSSWEKMPVLFRIELLMKMAGYSIDNKDKAKAIELINQAGKMMDSFNWPVRSEIPLRAQLAKLRFKLGENEKAQTELQEVLNIFEKNKEIIVNIEKAGILRSIAEAYQAIGDTIRSGNIYKQAIEAGIENPNSRPRSEDLSVTCCSMALYKFKPDTELFNRIKDIKISLNDPW
ncbi:MAG: hypothetical protein JW787_13480 [Sedimentisphaerales bacterium]|nr:hypothetical protein [Sedimentisphaerales bacterium]